MDSFKVFTFLILLQLWIYSFQASVKFGNLQCGVFQTDVISLEECRIRAVNRSHNIINIKYTLIKKVSELQMNLKLLKRERGGWHPFLYDMKIDMCEFFKRPYKFIVFNLIYKYGQNFTSLNHTCPYLPESKIMTVNWILSQNDILQKFPVELGVYAIHTTWFTNKKKLVEMNGTLVYE